MKAFEFTVYTNNSEVSELMVGIYRFFFSFQQKKVSLKRIISSISRQKNILSFFKPFVYWYIFVANKFKHRFVYCLLSVASHTHTFGTSHLQMHNIIMCKCIYDYYVQTRIIMQILPAAGRLVFNVICKNELCKL